MSRLKVRGMFGALIFLLLLFVFVARPRSQGGLEDHFWSSHPNESTLDTANPSPEGLASFLDSVSRTTQHIIADPLPPSAFTEMGKRIQILRSWCKVKEQNSSELNRDQINLLISGIEKTAISLFSFLRNSSSPDGLGSLENMRQRYGHGTQGIVIPTGKGTFRYACHLVDCLRNVLNSQLPIQVAYSSDADLPFNYRNFIKALGKGIDTLDVTSVLNDTNLQLTEDGWAIKPFAVLTSNFEQVMLLDADAVLLQPPEAIFDRHTGYQDTGALFFHDRLLWQGAFKERHAWWEKQLEHHTASKALAKSLVFNDGYAEECDSGMLVMDKGRLSTFLGLLHVCWQNTQSVRRDWTYKMGYGDKESWWFGLELSDVEYVFESHYGAVLGHTRPATAEEGTTDKVCAFTIAHTDEDDQLLWFNGSLLKNKAVNATEFDVPESWMMDGVWEKGATKADMSCMRDGKMQIMGSSEKTVLQTSVDRAQKIDERMRALDLL